MADPTPTLGVPPDATSSRDAVHVALLPAYADTPLGPGDRLEIVEGVRDGNAHKVRWVPAAAEYDAIVDPFGGPVPPGALFWAVFRPGSVTGLRHIYFHKKLRAGAPPIVGGSV